MREQAFVSRRAFLSRLGIAAAGTLAASSYSHRIFAQGSAPAVITPEAMRPAIPYGVASGDVTSNAAIIWSRTDRPGRMIVEYASTDSFKNPTRVVGPAALAASDFTARVDLTDLPPGQEIFYRVLFQDLAYVKTLSVPVVTQFEIYRHSRASRNLVKSMSSKDPAFAGTTKMSHYPPGLYVLGGSSQRRFKRR
jgi:alkaline phosphatase D